MDKDWNKVLIEIDEFLYGERGLFETAYSDRNLVTYFWNMDKIEEILKELKNIEQSQGGFSENQNKKLNEFKDAFLELYNGQNEIKKIYDEIIEKYKEI